MAIQLVILFGVIIYLLIVVINWDNLDVIYPTHDFVYYTKKKNYAKMYKSAKTLSYRIVMTNFTTDEIASVCGVLAQVNNTIWPSVGKEDVIDAIVFLKSMDLNVIVYACDEFSRYGNTENRFEVEEVTSANLKKTLQKYCNKYGEVDLNEETLLEFVNKLRSQNNI